MIPNIILTRSDVQITDKDALSRAVRFEPISHFGKIIQLLSELFVLLTIRHITASRHVEIVDCHTVFEPPSNMTRMTKLRKILCPDFLDWQFAQDRNAVVALLSPRHHVGVAKRRKGLCRDQLNGRFTFLQAQHIWCFLLQQFAHNRLAQAHGVDVPSSKSKAHGTSFLR